MGDRGPAAEPTAEAAAAERSLREWRSSVAKKEAVPAYVVLTDKDLIGIATELPRPSVSWPAAGASGRSASSGGVTRSSPSSGTGA